MRVSAGRVSAVQTGNRAADLKIVLVKQADVLHRTGGIRAVFNVRANYEFGDGYGFAGARVKLKFT